LPYPPSNIRKETAVALRTKGFLALLLAILCMAATLGYVYAASISATLNIQQGGTNVVSAKQFSTVTLQYSFTIDPVSTATGNVYYKYSAAPFDADDDATMESLLDIPITTISGWDGSERTYDFTIPDQGYYVFFLRITKGASSATTYYPATGTFHGDDPIDPLPEAPPIAVLALGFAALGLFVVVTKKRTRRSPP